MKTLSAPVSDDIDEKVSRRLRRAGYQTVAEYLRSLIRDDLKRDDDEQLLAVLLDDNDQTSPEERLNALRVQIRQGIAQLDAGQVVDGHKAIARTRKRIAKRSGGSPRKQQATKR